MSENENPAQQAPQSGSEQPAQTTQPAAQPETQPAAQPAAEQPTQADAYQQQYASAEAASAQDATQATQPVAAAEAAPQSAATQPMPNAAPAAPAATAPMPTGVPVAPAPGAAPQATPPSPTAALVCGILAIVFCFIPIVGIILGIVAIVKAGQYFKQGGQEGSGKAGKICGIIGIVLSVLMMVWTAFATFAALTALDKYDSINDYEVGRTASSQSSSSYQNVTTDEEDAVFAVCDARLDQLKNKDPEAVAQVALVMQTTFDEAMEDEDLDMSLATMGIDPTALATAMLDGFDYEHYYVDVDVTGGEAEAAYDVTVKSLYDVASDFYDRVNDYIDSADPSSLTEEDAYIQMGALLMEAVNAAPVDDTSLVDLDLIGSGTDWSLDEESWLDELDYLFAFN